MRHVLRALATFVVGIGLFVSLLLLVDVSGGFCDFGDHQDPKCAAGDARWADDLFDTAWPLVPLLLLTVCIGLVATLFWRRPGARH